MDRYVARPDLLSHQELRWMTRLVLVAAAVSVVHYVDNVVNYGAYPVPT